MLIKSINLAAKNREDGSAAVVSLKDTDVARAMLAFTGDDVTRQGLLETPVRMAKAWREWFDGYNADPIAVMKTFEDGAELCGDETVVVPDIDFYSHCEHHMAPFYGKAHIAYIPHDRVVGLSKLARVTDIFAHRLQVQERLTNQIANALVEGLDPQGVGVVLKATHFCMCSRGVNKQGSTTITSALRGAIKDEASCRAEFFSSLML